MLRNNLNFRHRKKVLLEWQCFNTERYIFCSIRYFSAPLYDILFDVLNTPKHH